MGNIKIDTKKYFAKFGTLNALAERVGTAEVTTRAGKKLTIRPISSAIEVVVKAAIPRPVPPTTAAGEPDLTDDTYKGELAIRDEIVKAGLIAASVVGLKIGERTYNDPGTDREDARARWVRDAAEYVLSNFHTEDLAAVLNKIDELSTRGRIGAAEDAGKGSGPASTTSPPGTGTKPAKS